MSNCDDEQDEQVRQVVSKLLNLPDSWLLYVEDREATTQCKVQDSLVIRQDSLGSGTDKQNRVWVFLATEEIFVVHQHSRHLSNWNFSRYHVKEWINPASNDLFYILPFDFLKENTLQCVKLTVPWLTERVNQCMVGLAAVQSIIDIPAIVQPAMDKAEAVRQKEEKDPWAGWDETLTNCMNADRKDRIADTLGRHTLSGDDYSEIEGMPGYVMDEEGEIRMIE